MNLPDIEYLITEADKRDAQVFQAQLRRQRDDRNAIDRRGPRADREQWLWFPVDAKVETYPRPLKL